MIRRLLGWLFGIDCTGPWTAEPHGGGPALDRTIEDAIRADERARHTTQADTAHGHMRRLSDALYPNGSGS